MKNKKKHSNVYGPYDLEDWILMKGLRTNVMDMTLSNFEKYRLAITKTNQTLKEIFFNRRMSG